MTPRISGWTAGLVAVSVPARLVTAAATLTGERRSSGGDEVNWGAALSAELTTITVPRERRRFAAGAALALLGRPRWRVSLAVAAAVSVAFGAGLLGVSRAGLGGEGLASVTLLLPPVVLFATGDIAARSTPSLRFGLETGLLAAFLSLIAVALVYGIEAAHWYLLAPDVSVLDGDHVELGSARAALHPVIILVHLVFWTPWPIVGAVTGARSTRATTS